MTDTQNDYVLTSEVADTLITLDDLALAYRVGRHTIDRWLKFDGIARVPFGREKAVRLGDIPQPSSGTTRWKRRDR